MKQLEFVEFSLPFEGQLMDDNKWVKLARLIPWEQFEDSYRKILSASGVGNPAFSVRLALAALIIKEELGVSDRECVQQITENPYLMYFCGFKAFIKEPPFDPSMMVHFRKRFAADVLVQVNNAIAKKVAKKKKPPKGPNEPPTSKPGKMDKKADNSSNNAPPANLGKLLVDTTCAPADITFPTDIKLLNKAREKSELNIDILHKVRGRGYKKPRTYRQRASFYR